jgi:hypothetical protein
MLTFSKICRRFRINIDMSFIAHDMHHTSERNVYKGLVGKSEGRRPNGGRSRKQNDNIETDVKGMH